jgi:hypothetical protein
MTGKRKFLFITVFVLYIITWVRGWMSHANYVEREAVRRYDLFSRAWNGQPIDESQPIVPSDHGSLCRVNWAVPLLPGVLLVYDMINGPVKRSSEGKVVIYYGIGSFVLADLWKRYG